MLRPLALFGESYRTGCETLMRRVLEASGIIWIPRITAVSGATTFRW